MREQRRPSFERMEASLLACPKCKRAVKVRKRLLLVLPQGDKYLYVCPDCGSTCGETIETPPPLVRKFQGTIFTLGAGVAPAQGGVEPTAGSTFQ